MTTFALLSRFPRTAVRLDRGTQASKAESCRKFSSFPQIQWGWIPRSSRGMTELLDGFWVPRSSRGMTKLLDGFWVPRSSRGMTELLDGFWVPRSSRGMTELLDGFWV